MSRLRLFLLLAWIALIVTAVIPWRNIQDHPHWQAIRWIPFVSTPRPTGDIVRNVVLYLPFGYLLARLSGDRVRPWHAAAYACALSLTTEATQVFSHSRIPSATDLTCNVAGAVVGFAWGRMWRGATERPSARSPRTE